MSRPSTSATSALRTTTAASTSIALNSPSLTTPTSVRVIDYDTFANYHSSSTPIQSDSLFPLFTYDRLDMPNTDLTIINIDSGYCASDTATIYSYPSTYVSSISTNDNYNYCENIPYYQTFENKFRENGDPHQHPEKNTDIHKNNSNSNNNDKNSSLTSPFSSTIYHDSSFSCSYIYSDESKEEYSPFNERNGLMNPTLSSVSSISSASDIDTTNKPELNSENQFGTRVTPQGRKTKTPKSQLNNSRSPKICDNFRNNFLNNNQVSFNNNNVSEIYDYIPVGCHFGKLPSYGDITFKVSNSSDKNNLNGTVFDPARDNMSVISPPSFKKVKLPLVKIERNITNSIYIGSTCKPTNGKHKTDDEPFQGKYKKRKLKLIGGKFKKDKENCESSLLPIQQESVTESEKRSKAVSGKLSLTTRTNVVKCPLTPHLKSTINIPLSEITEERLTQIINLTKLKKCSPREVEKMVSIFRLRNIHIKLRILAHIIGETNLMSHSNLHFPDIEHDVGVCLFDGNDGNLYLRAKTYAGFEKGKEQIFDNSIMSYFQNIKSCEPYFRAPNETTITLKQVEKKNKYSKRTKIRDDGKGNTIRFNINNKEKFVANIKNDTTSEEVKYIKRPLNSFMLYRSSMVRAAILLNLCNCMTNFLQKEIVRCGDIVKYDFSPKMDLSSKIPNGLNYYPRKDYDPISERLLLEKIETKLNYSDIDQRQEVIECIRLQLQHSKVNHHVLLHIISSMWKTETSFSKGKFQELSNLEKDIHSLCYPNYRYIPNKKPKK
ncbi:hypothetical protein B5S33_g3794 [[Candida] boidinii]|nr:hypothetical protein B5S30_g3420 [[Candida] boidinii]OWB85136.1 hypothetical protein B5S33_g3794 [[Candida] boidinii]